MKEATDWFVVYYLEWKLSELHQWKLVSSLFKEVQMDTTRVGWKVLMMMSYLMLMNFSTNRIQSLKQQRKKSVDRKEVYFEKQI